MSRRKVRLLSLVLDGRVDTNMSQFALAEPGIWLDLPSQGGFIKYSNISFAFFFFHGNMLDHYDRFVFCYYIIWNGVATRLLLVFAWYDFEEGDNVIVMYQQR